MKKTAIIYCPNHRPFTTPSKRWSKIAAILEKHCVDFDMVQSEKASGVERLMTMMIDNGYKDIVIAGGDSALNEAVNCLMRVDKRTREGINLGVIPNGTMNDFASFWGFTYDDIDNAVASIRQHRIRKIDLGSVRYTDASGQEHQRYFINCLNVGLLAGIQRLRQKMRRRLWSRKVSFAASLLMMVFQKTEWRMEYTINFVKENHRVTTLCIGSAYGYGQTPNAVPYNGLLDVTIVRRQPLLQFVGAIYLFLRGKILMHNRVRPYRSRGIDLEVPKNTPLSIDGHRMDTPTGPFHVNVEQEEINFIIEAINKRKA